MEKRNGWQHAVTVPNGTATIDAADRRDGLVTQGVRVAYQHPTPARSDWRCAAEQVDPDLFDPTDDATLAAIRRGLDDLAAGDVVSLDEVRAEHTARDRS
jgi:hypothetical protein